MTITRNNMALLSGPRTSQGQGQGNGPDELTDAVSAIYPLTRSQEGIWTEYLMDPQGTQYNLTLAWQISDDKKSYAVSLQALLSGTSERSY